MVFTYRKRIGKKKVHVLKGSSQVKEQYHKTITSNFNGYYVDVMIF
jgi:hypothetical protein